MRHVQIWTVIAIAMTFAACSSSPSAPTETTTSAPYSQTDLVVGTGTQVVAGNRVTVNYTGWLHDSTKPDAKGRQFDSGQGSTFSIGVGAVITGWDRGVPGMRVGGQRRLVTPPDLAYGSAGRGSTIPPNATLVFDITLVSVQ
jgi:FKBP-type peptidyl-prolyl cis-trans isomerase